ncbi:pentatricopeptide repeat-containing protein At5g48910-like [Malania oleifera]|uniref:pentatricopeptide repeat-containing protein At5g48910-like n=1 Tax=Malania oleifera TaxID=397392 RepID=UPI0025AE76A4|nr:pentatricopeptide repeat-containing protein At5g48910-like [Malania oleifera]
MDLHPHKTISRLSLAASALAVRMTLTVPAPQTLSVTTVSLPKKSTPNSNLSLLLLCKNLREANQVHALMIKSSQILDTYAASRLAEFYAISDNGSLEFAESVLDSIKEPYTFAWNTLIRGNLKKQNSQEAISLYDRMLHRSVQPDGYTFTSLLKACTLLPALALGKQIHSQIVKFGLEYSPFIRNKLIHLYAASGLVAHARKLFDTSSEWDFVTWNSMLQGYANNRDEESLNLLFYSMPCIDVVSWNTMISYYVQVGEFKEALEMFRQMQQGEWPDKVTLISVLTAVAHLGALAQGKWVHAYISKQRIEVDENLGSALITMYSKCGCLDGAIEAFHETNRKSVDTWNAMIGGLAANSESLKAVEMFTMMECCKVWPNAITFSCILKACSHGGLVEDGFGYFDKMKSVYGIEPDIVHYGCMVDLLGRAGLFEKAEEVIKSMPMKPDAVVWKALLGACRIHRNLKRGEKAGLKLIELTPDDHAGYILLSNIYAMADKWDQVHEVRKAMRVRQIQKPPGCSLVELNGVVHEFVVGDATHYRKKEIYDMLDEMGERLKQAGYEPDTQQVLLDIDEEEVKQTSLGHHSEKLAVAFSFISTNPGTAVRVIKNLRVCNDCHSAMKFLCMIYKRTIIIRDSTRFHHFQDGTCSCMDYW